MPDVRLLESVVLLVVLPLHAEDRPVAPPSQELVNVELREQLPAVRLDAPAATAERDYRWRIGVGADAGVIKDGLTAETQTASRNW